ncbi:MAG: phage tail protein [Bacteroidetes bacterium]|nr:MAG: phage tail protein [Bacteroidota bacterium]
MNDQYMGTIQLCAGTFVPDGWLPCDGRLLAIVQYQALFAIIGNTYGGNGTTTFALPDLRSRTAIGASVREVGIPSGHEAVTLTSQTIPNHFHAMGVSSQDGATPDASNMSMGAPMVPAGRSTDPGNGYVDIKPNVQLNDNSVTASGNSVPHNNRQPFQALYYIICLNGIFPPRS